MWTIRTTALLVVGFLLTHCGGDDEVTNSPSVDEPDTMGFVVSVQAPLPTTRQEIYPTGLGDEIIVVGGIDIYQSCSDRVEVYNPAANTWRRAASLPYRRHHIPLASVGNKVYATGGYTIIEGHWRLRGTVFEYDNDRNEWAIKSPMMTPRAEHVAAAYDGKIYTIGGRETPSPASTALNNNEVYDPATDTWTALRNMPTRRWHAAVAVLDSLIYVIGGRYFDGIAIENRSTNEAYSPQSDTWYRRANLPIASSGLSAAALNGKVYAFGGEYFTNDGGMYVHVWEYDPETNRWDLFDNMRTPRHGTDAVTISDAIYIIGGADSHQFGAVNVNERYSMPQQ